MCLKTWEEKSISDFDTIEDWCKFVNENEKYASNVSILDFPCKPHELPSFHPYWVHTAGRKKLKWYKDIMIEVVITNNLFLTIHRAGYKDTLESLNKDRKELKERLNNCGRKITMFS